MKYFQENNDGLIQNKAVGIRSEKLNRLILSTKDVDVLPKKFANNMARLPLTNGR